MLLGIVGDTALKTAVLPLSRQLSRKKILTFYRCQARNTRSRRKIFSAMRAGMLKVGSGN